MPKTPAAKSHTKAARSTPIPKEKPAKKPAKSKKSEESEEPTTTKPRDPTHSHLYTDDNPSTTIHGTGFKDADAAHRTLELISKRSLTYQFQTVNTMYHRAKHHPAMKKAGQNEEKGGEDSTKDMKEAMAVFREWLDDTYPATKASMRGDGGFKPLLSKKIVEKYLERIEGSKNVGKEGKMFAKTYVELGKGKRLGNVLVEDSKPAEPDWEARRYSVLCDMVPEGKEEAGKWDDEELWADDGKKEVSEEHLEMIAWAWSPVQERKLP